MYRVPALDDRVAELEVRTARLEREIEQTLRLAQQAHLAALHAVRSASDSAGMAEDTTRDAAEWVGSLRQSLDALYEIVLESRIEHGTDASARAGAPQGEQREEAGTADPGSAGRPGGCGPGAEG